MLALIVDDEHFALEDTASVIEELDESIEIFKAEDYKTAIKICEENPVDVAFLDIEMTGITGLELAGRIKEKRPNINIIFVTAFKEYALDALRLFASGYILKPASVEDISNVLENLRHPIGKKDDAAGGLYVKCFGAFDIFYGGKSVVFKRKKTKEFFAYLIDRRGASAEPDEIVSALWEDISPDEIEKKKNYLHQLYYDLKVVLEESGVGDILVHTRNAYSVTPEKISCDYYDYLSGEKSGDAMISEGYMEQYGWAEGRFLWD